MIRYDLRCDQGHAFDGWFSDSAAFDVQNAKGQVSCALCGSTSIAKQLMTPGLPAKSNRRPEPTHKLMAGPVDPRAQMLMRTMRELRKEVEAKAEYVGERFPEEARRIHYDEAEKRGIYGEASAQDARELIDEGIEVHPLPRLPEDGN